MTRDVVKRENNRALLPGSSRQSQSAGPLQNRNSKVLAQAQALIGELRSQANASAPPGIEYVHVPTTCSATGAWFIMIAECHDDRPDTLLVVRNELPQAGQGGSGSSPPPPLSREYNVEFVDGWACPLCGNTQTWFCRCRRFRGALHCQGNINGVGICACGWKEARTFIEAGKVPVRGSSVAATPNKTSRGPSHLQQVTYERTR